MAIDEMQAGRKMDILVSVALHESSDHAPLVWIKRRHVVDNLVNYVDEYDCPRCHDSERMVCVPRYSTDIAAALQVMMQAPKGWSVGLRRSLTGDWIADYGTASGRADTPELALCRAVLKAMGEAQ